MDRTRHVMRRILLVETSREEFVQRGQEVCSRNDYINCKLFAQLASGFARLEDLPETNDPQPGDIVAWPPRHYAIYLGSGEVMQVSEWGGDFEMVSLEQLISEYDEPVFLSVPR